jgi:hypothetical protein
MSGLFGITSEPIDASPWRTRRAVEYWIERQPAVAHARYRCAAVLRRISHAAGKFENARRTTDEADRPLSLLFLWGRDCPNCDIAKRDILLRRDRFRWEEIRWLHCNVYDDPPMATRFGLHGIPAFMLFRGSLRLGRISPWPGADRFCAAIARQITAINSAPG